MAGRHAAGHRITSESRLPLGAVGAAADQGEVREIELKAAFPLDAGDEGRHLRVVQLPLATALRAVQVPMIGGRLDVVLLLPACTVAVADEAQLFQDVEGSVHRRGHRGRVQESAALDDFGPGHVPFACREDLDHLSPLRRPAQSAATEVAADRGPRLGKRDGADSIGHQISRR